MFLQRYLFLEKFTVKIKKLQNGIVAAFCICFCAQNRKFGRQYFSISIKESSSGNKQISVVFLPGILLFVFPIVVHHSSIASYVCHIVSPFYNTLGE